MNNKSTPSPLTTTAPARFVCTKLNAFLARRALHLKVVRKNLNKAAAIDIDLDDISKRGCRDGLPEGFVNTAKGLFYYEGKKWYQLSSTPILPVYRHYSDCKTRNMGVELMTINHAGEFACADISLSDAMVKPDHVMASLAGKGFGISLTIKSKELLVQFLQVCMKKSLELPTYLVADSMGFVPGNKAFLHGSMPIAQQLLGFDYLIPASRVPRGIVESGTLDDWKTMVAELVHGWPQVFALSTAFASMLLSLCKMDVALFHFYGGSTTGKTILLQLPMSVHGHGGEPGSAPDVNILRWNTTANALEKNLSRYSGILACIDELGAYKQKDFASLLYNITASKGKDRMNQHLEIDEAFTWKMFILSSGEMSIPEKLATQKEQIQGGQEHRAISLNIRPEDARKDGETSEDVRDRAERLKHGLCETYGTAGKEFIACLLTLKGENDEALSYQEMCKFIQGASKDCYGILIGELQKEGYSLSDIQKRALERFALCWCAGILATEWNILPFDEDVIADAVMSAARRWLDDKPNQYNPVLLALIDIQRDLVKREDAHFIGLKEPDNRKPGNHWGYIHHATEDFLIFAPVFEEWCQKHSLSASDVAKELVRRKLLRVESKGHYKKRPLTGMDRCYYHIKRGFISADLNCA